VVRFRADQSEIALVGKDGVTPLRWLHQVSVPARMSTPERVDAGLVFDGASGGEDIDLKGKILVRLGAAVAPAAGGGAGDRRRRESPDSDHRWLGRTGAAAVAGGILRGHDAGGCAGGGGRRRARPAL